MSLKAQRPRLMRSRPRDKPFVMPWEEQTRTARPADMGGFYHPAVLERSLRRSPSADIKPGLWAASHRQPNANPLFSLSNETRYMPSRNPALLGQRDNGLPGAPRKRVVRLEGEPGDRGGGAFRVNRGNLR